MKSISQSVGKGGKNLSKDISVVLQLFRERLKDPYYANKLNSLIVPRADQADIEAKLAKCIEEFQRIIQKTSTPDGLISPAGNTILFLGGSRNTGKHIIVDLDDQNLYAFNGSRMEHKFYCTSGDDKHPTAKKPSLHRIFRKHERYTSKTYNARMDYAMFFTYDGKAIHQSNAVAVTSFLKDMGMNYFGSHGCVRLAEEDAQALFSWAPMNTPVFVDMA